MRQIGAVFQKELRTELRSRSGLLTVTMFSLAAVVALGLAGQGRTLSGSLASGLVWVALLFAAVVALPRAFIAEEEQGTGDLLRLTARPFAVFWGKASFNAVLMLGASLLLATLYVGMANVAITDTLVFLAALVGGSLALSGTVTLCGAIVAQAAHRSVLAGAIALPLLLPLIFLGVASLRFAFGDGLVESAWPAVGGMWLYGVAAYAIGPVLFESIWRA